MRELSFFFKKKKKVLASLEDMQTKILLLQQYNIYL